MAVPAAAWAAWAQPLCKCRTQSGVSKAPSAPSLAGPLPALGCVRGVGRGVLLSAPRGLPAPRRSALRPGPRRSGPPRRCAPHFPRHGDGGGRLSPVLAQELPREVTGSRCSPWPSPLPLPRRQEGPRRRRPGNRGSFHTTGRTCALLGCWWQRSVTSGGQRATLASAGSSLLSEAEAVTRRRSSQPGGCCRLEPPGLPRWLSPAGSAPLLGGEGRGGQAPAAPPPCSAAGHLEGQRPRAGLPGT